jgi:Txe/YoeB family toxin of Txe-Axe toxin-antitoxin module
MLYVDYVFEKAGNNIVFDAELKPESLKVKTGDKFVVQINEDNRIILVKVDEESK